MIIFFLIISSSVIGSYLTDTFQKSLWLSDDATHISAADSFRHGKNLELNFILHRPTITVDEALQKHDSNISEPYGRTSLYYILLGSFYALLNTTPDNFLTHASIFQNILSSLFLILFFFLIRKYFDIKIAVISSFFVLIFPYIAWESVRALPTIIFYISATCALFFLQKTTKHYFMFGIFSGLAHLGHPMGIVFGFSYVVFLLINKEIRGALIAFAAWIAVLIPQFVRNYYFWKEIGKGLYIPFQDTISELLWFLPTVATKTTPDLIFSFGSGSETKALLDPYLIFQWMFHEFQTVHTSYLIFFLVLSIFAFISIKSLGFETKRKKIVTTIFLTTIISIYVITASLIITDLSINYYFSEQPSYELYPDLPELESTNNPYISIFFIFILPIIIFILVILFFKKFFLKVSRYQSFLVLYVFLNLIIYYYISLSTQNISISNRHFLFMLFLLIPVAFVGLSNVIKIIYKKSNRTSIISIFFIVLIIFTISYQSVQGIEFFKTNSSTDVLNEFQIEKIDNVGTFLRNNANPDSKILSNFPSHIYLKTGLKAVGIPIDIDCTNMEKFLDYFKPSYFVAIFPVDVSAIHEISSTKYFFDKIPTVSDPNIINVYDIVPENSVQAKANYLNSLNYEVDLNEDSENIEDLKLHIENQWTQLEKYANTLLNNKKYSEAISIYNNMSKIDRYNYDLIQKRISLNLILNNLPQAYDIIDESLIKFETAFEFELCNNNLQNYELLKEKQKNYSSLVSTDLLNGDIAISNYIRFLGVDPNNPNIWADLSKFFQKKGLEFPSIFSLQEALKNNHENNRKLTLDQENLKDEKRKFIEDSFNIDIESLREENALPTLYNKFELGTIGTTLPKEENIRILNLLVLLELNYEAKKLEFEDHELGKALSIYDEMISIEEFSLDALESKIRIFVKQEKNEELIEAVEDLIQRFDLVRADCIPNYIGNHIGNCSIISQDSYIRNLKNVAKIYAELGLNSRELVLYQEILNLDRFDVETLLNLARIYEDKKPYQLAISYYNQALWLVNDENMKKEIINKIEELQEKIAS